MSKEDFLVAISYLSTAYRKEFTKEEVSVWYDMFENVAFEDFKIATKNLIATKPFMPSIAEIKQEIARINTPELKLNVDEEWQKVLNAIRTYGSYREEKALRSLNHYTRKIVRMIGYQRLCQSESIEWERKTFKELFLDNQQYTETNTLKQTPMLENKELQKIEFDDDKFTCNNCHETYESEEIGTSELALQDGICIHCQEDGYGL